MIKTIKEWLGINKQFSKVWSEVDKIKSSKEELEKEIKTLKEKVFKPSKKGLSYSDLVNRYASTYLWSTFSGGEYREITLEEKLEAISDKLGIVFERKEEDRVIAKQVRTWKFGAKKRKSKKRVK